MRADPIQAKDATGEGRGRTAVVTGASSGIGRATATLLAAKGYDVVVAARRLERLTELQGELQRSWDATVEPWVVDLSDPADTERFAAALQERPVDLLVNNAGNSRSARFDELPWETHAARLHLMGTATQRLSHAVLPRMVDRGWGRILNVASIGAVFTGFPTDIGYAAAKGMVERFSEALDGEFRGLGVRCTVSLPGPTVTEIFTHPGTPPDVAEHPLFRHVQMSPEAVARESYAAVMAGKPFVVPGLQYKPLGVVLQYTPRAVRRRLSSALCRVMAE